MTASAHRRPLTLRAAFVALVALATLTAGLAVPATAPAAAKRLVKPSALPAFPSCASLLSYARRGARLTGGRTGVPTRAAVMAPQVLEGPVQNDVITVPTAPPPQFAEGAPPTPPPAASPAIGGRATPDFSQTNVQEAGVDEPDIVKTNGRTVFAVSEAKLHAIDVTGAAPRLVGTLALDGAYGHQLLLRGDRLLVMSSSYGGVPP